MKQEFAVLHLFSGIGGAALGFQEAVDEYKGMVGRYRTLAGIDSDPEACADFEALTGAPAVQMDLFSRADYEAFHGKEPPSDWREVTAADLLAATGGEHPDVVFLSPPCKGFSGLLPSQKAASEKYQALNRLVVRGLKLTMEAYRDDLPAVIMLENVPRITSRGAELLKQVKRLLGAHGYLFHEGYHDCGEIGGLAQRRKRYLLIARNKEKMTALVYRPPLRKVRAIGEVIGPMPMPDDPIAGPMHRLPRLQWKTWVRLALIPAGGDWRDLEALASKEWHHGAYRIIPWEETAGTVTSGGTPSCGSVSVADPRLAHDPRAGGWQVAGWAEPAGTVVGHARVGHSNGIAAIADPRLPERYSRHPAVYQVVKWDEPGPCVTGTRFGSGSPAVADPRVSLNGNAHLNLYRVEKWDEPSHVVTGAVRPAGGGISIADPRITTTDKSPFSNVHRIGKWNEPAHTITGATRPIAGSLSIADPRVGCNPRSGAYKVQAWDEPSATVIGAGDIHAGATAIADPRIPDDNERPDPPPVIIALDGTWHRPLTTLELAALQGFPLVMPDGRPLELTGKSDARWRERIGNAVPPPAARAVAEQILMALLVSAKKEWVMGCTEIWVIPPEDQREKRKEVGK